jgi:hypothetical protein
MVMAVRAARRSARTRVAGLEAEMLARVNGLSNQELASRLPALAEELGHAAALRIAAARLSRPSRTAALRSTVTEAAIVALHLASAAWAGLSHGARAALVCATLAAGLAWWWG